MVAYDAVEAVAFTGTRGISCTTDLIVTKKHQGEWNSGFAIHLSVRQPRTLWAPACDTGALALGASATCVARALRFGRLFVVQASLFTTAFGLGNSVLNGFLADPSSAPDYRVTHSKLGGMNHRLTDITQAPWSCNLPTARKLEFSRKLNVTL